MAFLSLRLQLIFYVVISASSTQPMSTIKNWMYPAKPRFASFTKLPRELQEYILFLAATTQPENIKKSICNLLCMRQVNKSTHAILTPQRIIALMELQNKNKRFFTGRMLVNVGRSSYEDQKSPRFTAGILNFLIKSNSINRFYTKKELERLLRVLVTQRYTYEAIELLVNYGVDPHAKGWRGQSAFDRARSTFTKEILAQRKSAKDSRFVDNAYDLAKLLKNTAETFEFWTLWGFTIVGLYTTIWVNNQKA